MEREVKIGIAIGVLLVALVGIFIWAGKTGKQADLAPPAPTAQTDLWPTVEPVPPAGSGLVPIEPAEPEVAAPPIPVPDAGAIEAPAPVEPPPQPMVRTHTVQKGDTLYSIAMKCYGTGAKWKLIHNANKDKIRDPETLIVGTRLLIPDLAKSGTLAPAAIHTPQAGTRTHTVAKGESLRLLAKKYYGTEAKWKLIYDANRRRLGDNPNLIKQGIVLLIPADR